MRIQIFAAIAVLTGSAGLALADDGRTPVQETTISEDAIGRQLDTLGYDVRRIKLDDGAYKVRIRDRESGGVVKAMFDPRTGTLVRAKPAD